MSKDTFINNLLRVASSVFTQFKSDEPLISEETTEILSHKEGRDQIYNKIISKKESGEITLTVNGKETKFFVES